MSKLLIGVYSYNNDISINLATSLVAISTQAVDVDIQLCTINNVNSQVGVLGAILEMFVKSEREFLLLLDKDISITPGSVFAAIHEIKKDTPPFDIVAFPVLDGDLSGTSDVLMSTPIGDVVNDLIRVEVASLNAIMISKYAAEQLMLKFDNIPENIFGAGMRIDITSAFFTAVKMADLLVGMKINAETSMTYSRNFGYGPPPIDTTQITLPT